MKSGILAVHKPEGMSSARVVGMVKKALKAKKVGHTGTLDPFATGLLLCAINKGTRISRFFLDGHKRYTGTVHLGVETDTFDKTGQVVSSSSPEVTDLLTKGGIERVVRSFSGVQKQSPPVFSALKHKGQPLYKLARQGKMIQKPARTIEIFDIKMTRLDLPEVDIEVHCSSGTYIRTIAHDIGKKLGCGAHLSRLCRTMSSQFCIDKAIEVSTLAEMDKPDIEGQIIPLSEALPFLTSARVIPEVEEKIRFGKPLLKDDIRMDTGHDTATQTIRVLDDENRLLALIEFNEKKQAYDYSCVFAD